MLDYLTIVHDILKKTAQKTGQTSKTGGKLRKTPPNQKDQKR
tara:strand:+ start:185 stop:310 length:126 start_codon:yes stop_codon:yes gene_type:complete